MSNTIRTLLLAALLSGAASPATAASASTSCSSRAARPAILFRVTGFKQQTGLVNVWVYGSNTKDFLVRDKRILRLQFPVPSAGPMEVCIAILGPGRYAIAAHHDLDSNDKRDISDGLGFSGNPRLSLMRLKPSYAQTSFVVGNSVHRVDLVLRYRAGLSIKPISPRAR